MTSYRDASCMHVRFIIIGLIVRLYCKFLLIIIVPILKEIILI